jgi:hypothetical protein
MSAIGPMAQWLCHCQIPLPTNFGARLGSVDCQTSSCHWPELMTPCYDVGALLSHGRTKCTYVATEYLFLLSHGRTKCTYVATEYLFLLSHGRTKCTYVATEYLFLGWAEAGSVDCQTSSCHWPEGTTPCYDVRDPLSHGRTKCTYVSSYRVSISSRMDIYVHPYFPGWTIMSIRSF